MLHRSLPSGRHVLLAAIPLLALIAVLTLWLSALAPSDSVSDFRESLVAFASDVTQQEPETADLVPIAYTGVNTFGINVFLEQEVEESKIRKSLELARDAGFGWIKQEFLWHDIEQPSKGRYVDLKNNVANTWDKYDRIVRLCNEYGLQLIARLDTSPAWARRGNEHLQTPPDDYSDFADFVGDVAKRYRGKVKYYQIWNEPNLDFEWGRKPVDATQYTELLRQAFVAAKSADPDCVIIAAALAPTVERSSAALSELVYLQGMYDAGASKYFDIMAANAYGLRSGPYDRRATPEDDINFSRPVLIRELMVRNGDSHKPIWASETGWCALPSGFPDPPVFGRVSREQQARYTVQAFERAQREWPWMGVMSIWHLRLVHEVNTKLQYYYFGLLDVAFDPFPVYWSVGEMTRRPPVLEYGYREDSHPAIEYSGQWTTTIDPTSSDGAVAASSSPGDSVRFSFRGTALDLIAAGGPAGGVAEVKVDGLPANRLRLEASRSYIDFYSSDLFAQRRIPIAAHLSYGPHTAELIVTEQGNSKSVGTEIKVDAWIVDKQLWSLRSRLVWAAMALGIVVGIVVAAAMGRWAWRQQH